MAIKKNELYSSLWASCDKLRGGMDASQYKDYILTLLFVKYVTDKFKGVKYADITVPEGGSFDDLVALKGNKNIGEGIDKVIAKLAEAGNNNLRGVIDNAHFNDEAKLGSGKEMVDKLSDLIAIFQRPEFDFKNNKASGDDILGDAYEYLMRNFASESGKSKGQFYTPAEVSRILAKVIGIDKIEERDEGYSVYDPACGSGSLLIRAANEAPFEVSIWGQEKEVTTAGLAKMNLVLHNKAAGEIKAGNTFSSPKFFEEDSNDEVLKRFDFAVANPPFSLKNWTDGLKDYGRFSGYGDMPPEKNGDFAWLMHILKSLKSTGKAAVVLPHGVLFRGNAEATIRRYIKGIIGLPANLFFGTGIPACIIIIDKSDADERQGIFMIDASHDFIKDGNKNRLRERDIYKIVTTFNQQITSDPKYARFVTNNEIKIKNNYNLNITRYIDSTVPEDLQDIDAHLNGGIPAVDVDSMEKYWTLFPNLKNKLFSVMREGYYKLNIPTDEVRNAIYNDEEFSDYTERIDDAFDTWKNQVDEGLKNIDDSVDVKQYIVELAEALLNSFDGIELIDKYDVYEVLLSYWQEIMGDDIYLVSVDGYNAAKTTENIMGVYTSGKKKGQEKIVGWEGVLLPKSMIEKTFFTEERKKINEAQNIAEETQNRLDELTEEQTGDEGYLKDYLNDKDKVDAKAVAAKIKELKKAKDIGEEFAILSEYMELSDTVSKQNKIVKELNAELEMKVKAQYSELTDGEILELLVNRKWYYTVFDGIKNLYVTASHNMANRILELAERYKDTLPFLNAEADELEKRVTAHLERMGFKW